MHTAKQVPEEQHPPPVDDPSLRTCDDIRERLATLDEPLVEEAEQAPRESFATLENLGSAVVVTVTVTEFTGIEALELTQDLLKHIQESSAKHAVLDLQNVGYMDSSCIGALVELVTTLQEDGGRVALVNAGQSVEYLFRLTKLDRVFPICKDVMMAINSVERESDTPKKKRRGFLRS